MKRALNIVIIVVGFTVGLVFLYYSTKKEK